MGFATLDHTDAAVGPLTWQESVHLSALRQVLLGASGQQHVTVSEHQRKNGNCNRNVNV